MTINEARLIRELKKRCTYRRLAEIYYPSGVNGHGNQMYGRDLCIEALQVLYPNRDVWKDGPEPADIDFYEDNRSYLGDFYWYD